MRERLIRLEDRVRAHPSYASAKRLLNQHFRASTLVQRAAVLESASFLISVLEAMTRLD